jgi:hypothetical protein
LLIKGEKDYKDLPKGIPVIKVSLDTGHMGTYFQRNGGKFGKAAVAYFNAVLKGDERAKAMFSSNTNDSPLVKDGWTIASKNWI